MSIIQFLRIFWARRMVVLITMIASFLGSYVVTLLVQPRYEATSRVMLDVISVDPITGDTIGRSAGAYYELQAEQVKDYAVTGAAVDALGFLSDPGRIAAYQSRPESDNRDFRRWLAQDVADAVKVGFAGPVLEITYRAPNPAAARVGAEVLRDAYIQASLDNRRAEATKNARFYTTQAENARKLAETAEMAKAAYEKESGIVMDRGSTDMESERLAALASQAAAGTVGAPAPATATSAMELAQLDARIADLSTKLGPNHPVMQELRARRGTIAKLAEQDKAAQFAASSGVTGRAALNEALAEQKARVIGQRDKVERLRQLLGEVDLRRDQYRAAAAKAGQFTMESAVVDNRLSPLGVVVSPKDPVFPNKKLMVGGAVGLGAALGLAISLLLELLNRRVRGVEDLHLADEIPCLCVVESNPGRRRFTLRRLFHRRQIEIGAAA